MNITKYISIATIITSGFYSSLNADSLSFDLKDPKGVNNAQFQLDAPLEQISGFANGVSGAVSFDPSKPEMISGSIVIDAASITVGNPVMLDHLHGSGWVDVKKYPEVSFIIESASNLKETKKGITMDVTGTFSLKGTSKKITAPVVVTYLKDKLGARINSKDAKGDLLVIRSDFSISRSEFGIKPGQNLDKVSDDIEISLRVVGSHAK